MPLVMDTLPAQFATILLMPQQGVRVVIIHVMFTVVARVITHVIVTIVRADAHFVTILVMVIQPAILVMPLVMDMQPVNIVMELVMLDIHHAQLVTILVTTLFTRLRSFFGTDGSFNIKSEEYNELTNR